MKHHILAAGFLLCLCVCSYGQRNISFNAFPARAERATARSIDFKNSPGARAMRTRLGEALREGVNFAGHYIVAGWGCGTGCISAAIIDGRTGRVYFPKAIGGISVGTTDDDGGYVEQPLRYQKNSRLLILTGIPETQIDNGKELPMGMYYYEWRNNNLRLIRRVIPKGN